jgi:hypothetical protein
VRLRQSAVRGPEMKNLITRFISCVAFALPMLMIYSSPASAEYNFQLVIPPGVENASTNGINNAGKVTGFGWDRDGVNGFSFIYDMKSGEYTTTSDDVGVLDISNAGVMVGDVDGVCAIRDKKGKITLFNPPSFGAGSFCQARGVNSNGKVSGIEIDADGGWLGFIYDSKHGTYEEFFPSPQTIAQGINAQGQNVGSVFLDADEAFPGSPADQYAYLRQTDGSVKYFAISQSAPGRSRIRGISENGLISGFYLDPDTFEIKGYVTTLSKGTGFETITLADDEVVFQSPCNPDLPPPEPGFVTLTDMLAMRVRNDGVVVGSCTDYQYNETTDVWITYATYGFIATPID